MIGIKALLQYGRDTDNFDSADLDTMVQSITGVQFGGGKGGGSTVVEKPVYTPPPAAPQPAEAATQQEAVSPEEEAKRKREALKSGTKSLQIPVTTDAGGASTVGTGTTATKA